jgi:hypothetical protein
VWCHRNVVDIGAEIEIVGAAKRRRVYLFFPVRAMGAGYYLSVSLTRWDSQTLTEDPIQRCGCGYLHLLGERDKRGVQSPGEEKRERRDGHSHAT